jgi:hypothetical protein
MPCSAYARRSAVGDAAEHRAAHMLGRVDGELPADACSQRVAHVAGAVDEVGVEHGDEVGHERTHRVGERVVGLVARAVPALVHADDPVARAGERAHPAGLDPVVAAARREAVDAEDCVGIRLTPGVGRDPVSLRRHDVRGGGHLGARERGEGIHAPILLSAAGTRARPRTRAA